MLRTRYKSEIDEAAAKWELDPLLVEAVVVKESEGNTDAFRFEPTYWNRCMKGKEAYRHLNPRRVSSRYGLMGVMYARVLGEQVAAADMWAPEMLFVPENGLDVGCGFLAELLEWAGALPAGMQTTAVPEFIALAAYADGKGGNDPNKNWPLRNGVYARNVLSLRAQLMREYAPR